MVWYPYQSRSITPTSPNDDAMPEVSRVRIETCRVRAAPVNRLSDATQMQDVTDDDESDFAARKEWRATSDRERPLPSLSLMMTRQQVLSSRSSGKDLGRRKDMQRRVVKASPLWRADI
jgi:hypothetical protein